MSHYIFFQKILLLHKMKQNALDKSYNAESNEILIQHTGRRNRRERVTSKHHVRTEINIKENIPETRSASVDRLHIAYDSVV
jgi:hypothetical protein